MYERGHIIQYSVFSFQCQSCGTDCSFAIIFCRLMYLDDHQSQSTKIMILPPSQHRHQACVLRFVMLAINQPVGQIDTNQPWTPSHPAWLPISEMAGTTHSVPSALHFISKCLYHLSARLVHTWGTFRGVRAAVWLWHSVALVWGKYFCVYADLKMFWFQRCYLF